MRSILTCTLLGLLSPMSFAQEEPEAKLIVVDDQGKEQRLTKFEFQEGTEHLSFLAPAEKEAPEEKAPAEKKPRGPEALAFREKDSTSYKEGILTYVPLKHLRSVSYDYENKTATVRVATSDKVEEDIVLTGSAAEYAGINTVTILAEVDKGAFGIAEIKYRGGVKGGIQSFRMPSPEPLAAPMGNEATLTYEADREKHTAKAVGLTPYYQVGLGENVTAPVLFFRKTIKIPLAKLKGLEAVEGSNGRDWKVTLISGDSETFTLLQPAQLDGKTANLKGVIGRTKAGYRLFPLHVLSSLEIATTKEEN